MEANGQRLFKPWVVAILCALPYLGFWLYGLTDLDEGFYGAVVTDMLRRGDWLTPTLNGVPWFEKPILSYWLAMPSVALFGNEFGARLPSLLCTMGTCFVLARFARKHFNECTSQLVPMIYATGLLTVAVGRMMMTDSALVLCLTLAITTFFDSLVGDRRLRLWTAAFLGLAILAKGPVGAVLFVIAAGFLHGTAKSLRPAFKGCWLVGTLILVAVVSMWYVPAYLANGQFFIDKFLVEQNIGRFAGGDKAHQVPFWAHPIFFPMVILLGSVPWLIPALRRGLVKSRSWQGDDNAALARKFMWIWLLTILCFFTISGTKLVHYILPAMPALALLMADTLSRWQIRRLRTLAVTTSLVVLSIANYVFYFYWAEQFAGVQDLAKYARESGERLCVFSLGGKGKPEIKLTLDDTSHPSIGFYYKQPFVEANSIEELANLAEPHLVIVRQADSNEISRMPGSEMVRARGGYLLFRFSPSF